MEESAATGVWRAKQRDSRTEYCCRAALTSPRGLSAHPLGRAGAGSWGLGFGRIAGRGLGLAAWTQPEGVSASQLAGRESGKQSAAAEEARDVFLPLCFLLHEERGFRAPPKRAPEMGASRGYQRGLQRRAGDAKAAAAATKKPVCEHRSLSTPPLLGASAARHCQGPVIQEQLPRENALHVSGWCNVMRASDAAGSPRIHTPHSPRPEWARAPESAAPLTPFCLSGNRRPQATYTQRRVQIQSWIWGAVRTKKRKGNLSQQPQEQRIKYPQLTWCTLHLLNTRIDNESAQNSGSGLWEQRYTYIFPFSLFVSVYVYASLCDFVCIALLLPFVLGFSLSVFLLFVCFSIVFRVCYHWWICFLVWLLSSFFLFFITF